MKNKIFAACLAFALILTSNVFFANSLELTNDVMEEESNFNQVSEVDASFVDNSDQSATDSTPVENENDSSVEVEVVVVPADSEITEEPTIEGSSTEENSDTNLETEILADEEILDNSIENSIEEEVDEEDDEEEMLEGDTNIEESVSFVSDSFINDCTIVFERNEEFANNEIQQIDDMKTLGSVSTMSTETEISSDVYTTAPEILNVAALSIENSESSALRFVAKVTLEQRVAAFEYGFLMCEAEELENSNTELTLDNTSVSFVRGVAYNRDEEIDDYFANDDEGFKYAGLLTNIPIENFVSYITARPYIIYDVNGTLTYVYGNTYSHSIYRLSKTLLSTDLSEENRTIIKGYVLDAENAISLSTADEVYLDERINRSIGINPDIDIIKFTPETSSFYTLSFSSEDDASYEILDEFGKILPCVASEDGSAYLFEKNQTYYIRVRGEANTDYSLNFTLCLENAIIMDFADDTEGFTFGDGATGTVENGLLNISIEKSISLSKAYTKNSNLDIDLFDYSRLIIRLKNETSTTKLAGTVGIDLEYDGTSQEVSLESSMPTGMLNFENIEFDFTTRYGSVNSLKFSFGSVLSALSGNIYIDSIAILPMPEVLAWEFDETNGNWSDNDRIGSAVIEDGALVLDFLGSVTGMAPAIVSPGTSAYDFDKYNVITIALKNETSSTNMQVYFSTLAEGHTSFSENKKFTVEIEPSSNEFIEYSMHLTDHELFTDSLKDIMISIPSEGTVSIDYIRLSKHETVYNDVIWNFENDLEGFSSNNERHTLSVYNGVMIVETQDMGTGAFYTPSKLNLPTSEYRYLVVGVKSSSVPSDFQVYFTTSTMNSSDSLNYNYLETDNNNKVVYKHTLQIEKSIIFKEYVIDLSYAWENYTTGYTGNLEQLMLALPKVGTFEIDYIKLSTGNDRQKLNVSTNENSEYKIFVSKNNNHTIGTYTVEYDAEIFELVDACVFSYPPETEIGQVMGTDISITSVSEGTVTFAVSNKTTAGAINCLKLKALKNADSTICVTTSVE